jgi:hypothetical protein
LYELRERVESDVTSEVEWNAIREFQSGGRWTMLFSTLTVNIEDTYPVEVKYGETLDDAVNRQLPKWLVLALTRKNPLPGLPFLWDVSCQLKSPIIDACLVRVGWELRRPLCLLPILKPFSIISLWFLGRRYR